MSLCRRCSMAQKCEAASGAGDSGGADGAVIVTVAILRDCDGCLSRVIQRSRHGYGSWSGWDS
jgi:hypothetical protein